jgi:hypothetical protein
VGMPGDNPLAAEGFYALAQEEFRIPFPNSLLAAYYITHASAARVPVDHDAQVVQAYYEKFYRLARRYSGLIFDPTQVGALESKYNDVHRRLAGKADKPEIAELKPSQDISTIP